ncbi:MAG TPA: Clp protease N-terminal domain-containing protein, partial [Trueperaceae bacterium]|nr:Clp protease N-terminal domain-containing protein [Trueperaceae bacterium]
MDQGRFTEAALQMVASAQQVARARQHQQVTPVHLLTALLADPSGLPSRVVEAAGGSADAARQALDQELERLPQVSGGGGELYLSNDMARALQDANAVAQAWGDAFVAQDVLLVAARRALPAFEALPKVEELEAAAREIRGGRSVDTQTAESTFDALERYGIDLT